MPTYDYKCIMCDEEYEIIHSIKLDALKEYECPKCRVITPCKRIMSVNSSGGFRLEGNGWTVKSSGFGKRGYKGKYQNQIRPIGSEVLCPNDKKEADRFFQNQVDNGMLENLDAVKHVYDKDNPSRPKVASELVEKDSITRKKG